MDVVRKDDKIKVHYHGKLANGTTFDSSAGREPLEFTVGSGQVIKGFDDAVIGMKVGDSKTVDIPVMDAYGERNAELMLDYAIAEFPSDLTPEIGLELHMSDDHGNVFPVVIKEINDDRVLLDANHPLAGENLIFEIEIVSVNQGT